MSNMDLAADVSFHRSIDPRPLRVRVVDALRQFPDGATCAQLSEVLGDFQYTISSIVSKMHCYGGAIERVGRLSGMKNGSAFYWRLKRDAK